MPTPPDPPRPLAVTPEEAAAVIAAVEQFLRDTVPPAPPAGERVDPWTRRALLEGVGRDETDPTPWGDPHPWG